MKDHSLYHVAEEVNGKPTRVHKFHASPSDDDEDRHSAYLAVRHFDNLQFRDPCSPFTIYQINEWVTRQKVEDRWEQRGVKRLLTELPVVEHATVWDFFQTIGWDSKELRFNES